MKKLMIMLAAVCMAVAANASTFSWGISGALDATTFESGTAYLFYTSASTLSLPDTSSFATKTSFTQADITSSGVTLYGTGAVVDGEFLSAAEDVKSLGGSTGVKRFYMAVISDDGKNVAIVTSTKTARIMAATTAAAASWNSSQFATYTAVPEPTSGLLMLVGLAGLALRRRRA